MHKITSETGQAEHLNGLYFLIMSLRKPDFLSSFLEFASLSNVLENRYTLMCYKHY
jgi:hypothetical protein